jgi:putative chitinase
MNTDLFYSTVRSSLFRGKLLVTQVAGISAIIAEWKEQKLCDLRWLAYILATTYHETAETMQPIREYGRGKGRKYGEPDSVTEQTYYGRGYVQLTWRYNYAAMSSVTGVDLGS